MKQPEKFLKIRVHDINIKPTITGLCVGYERNVWRASQFARHIFEWLPEFALKDSEIKGVDSANMVSMIRNAAKRVYDSGKFQNRGEFGELFLHATIRQVFNSEPAISKIYYKTATNDTIKGFDAVHIIESQDGELELWLGEAKFYSDIGQAISDVIHELQAHTETDYLRNEFLLIKGKIDSNWKYAKKLEALLSENKSLDEVFVRACIPILLTYDSDCLKNHTVCDTAYEIEFETEIRKHYTTFKSKNFPSEVTIHLILLPLNTKDILISELDAKLKAWQII
jgi:hypothetical protein